MTREQIINSYCKNGKLQHIQTWENPDGSIKIKFFDIDKNDKTFRQAYATGKKEDDYCKSKPEGWIDSVYIAGCPYHKDEGRHIIIDSDYGIVTEGEKDADTVACLDRPAFSGAAGGGAWLAEYTNQLTGKTVYIISDNDATGNKYIKNVINALYDKATVILIDIKELWPDCPEKGDITDMVEAIGQEETKKRLDAKIEALNPFDDAIKEPIPEPENANKPALMDGWPLELEYDRYDVDDYGVARIKTVTDENGETREILSMILPAPIIITKTYEDIETHEQKKELWCRRVINGKPYDKTIVVDNETIFNTRKITEISKYGFPVKSTNAKEVVDYLFMLDANNVNTIPIEKTISHMGRYDDNPAHFVPYVDDIHPDGNGDFPDMTQALKPAGDYDKWKACIRACVSMVNETGRTVSYMAQMALAASFAAPVIEMLGCLNFFVDFFGKTGCGKTVAAMIGASVWGNPREGEGYTMRLDGTRVSFEAAASFLRNIPLILDESQLIAKKRDGSLSWDPVYYLAEGASRSRSNINLGLRKSGRWATTIITTGEQPLADSEADGGKKNRIVEVECFEKEKDGSPTFLKNHGDKVCDVITENYGYAGREWIKLISNPEVFAKIKELYDVTKELLIHAHISTKQAISGALLIAVYNVADEYLIHSGNLMTVPDIAEHLQTDDDVDTSADFYDRFISYLAAHSCEIVDKKNGEGYGPSERPILGVRKAGPDDQHDYLDLLYEPFCEACERIGTKSVDMFVKWMTENEKMEQPAGKHKYNYQSINGHMCKCVRLIVDAVEVVPDSDSNVLSFPS